jgi:hypothetical protein
MQSGKKFQERMRLKDDCFADDDDDDDTSFLLYL